jgi:hypothetical protein
MPYRPRAPVAWNPEFEQYVEQWDYLIGWFEDIITLYVAPLSYALCTSSQIYLAPHIKILSTLNCSNSSQPFSPAQITLVIQRVLIINLDLGLCVG